MIGLTRGAGGDYYLGDLNENDGAHEEYYLTMRTREALRDGQRDLVIRRGPLFNVAVMSQAEALEVGLFDDPSVTIEEVRV